MEQQSKLYKCYKDGCYFRHDHSDGPYLTQSEYDELPRDNEGKLLCPESNLNCGIQELTPEDYASLRIPRKPLNIKLIAGAIVGVILIAVAAFLFLGKSGESTDLVEVEPSQTEEYLATNEADSESEPGEPIMPDAKPENQTIAPAASNNQTKNFPNGDRYVGEVKSGQMHGLGTYYYSKRQRISDRDRRERMAEAGDYIIGEWFEGGFVQGRLFDKDGNQKEVVIIGR